MGKSGCTPNPSMSMISHEIIWWDTSMVQVKQLIQVMQVMQVRLTHLWPNFSVIFLHLFFAFFIFCQEVQSPCWPNWWPKRFRTIFGPSRSQVGTSWMGLYAWSWWVFGSNVPLMVLIWIIPANFKSFEAFLRHTTSSWCSCLAVSFLEDQKKQNQQGHLYVPSQLVLLSAV